MTTSDIESATFSVVGKLAAGQNHTLVVKTDGTVWAWGSNSDGQLGNGATSAQPASIPGQVKSNATSTFIGALTVAGGASHSAAVKTDGSVWAWGNNASGQLGDGSTTPRLYPVQVVLVGGAALDGVVDLECGSEHCVALKSDGTVWAWGLNTMGQVGNGTINSPQLNPVQVAQNANAFLTGIVSIAAGDTHSVALKSNGTVWAWGLNTSGQLGNGGTAKKLYATKVKIAAGVALTGVSAIAAGGRHSLAIKADGTLWAWGRNANGQLADGTTTPTSSSKELYATQSMADSTSYLSGITAVAGGANHTMALKNDGTLWAWGLNSSGQLGDGSTTQEVFPVQVFDASFNPATDIADLFAGASHSLATKSDGTAWGWGLNSSGQGGSLNSSFNPPLATQIKIGSFDYVIITALDDPDHDGLLNWEERAVGTNPNLYDTDGDGLPDGYEVLHSLDPLSNDASADPDADGLSNAQEYALGTDPHLDDTDLDGAKDNEDVYPLDPHFALKKTGEPTFAVIEIANDSALWRAKMNNLNSVVYSEPYGTVSYLPKSWLWSGGTPLYLFALDEPHPAPPPNSLPDSEKYYVSARDINDGGQIVGSSSYEYPPDFQGSNEFQIYRRLSHAVRGTGGTFTDLGDGAIDNGVNDVTGDPTIDGTNKAESGAVVISNGGMVVGGADFYVDVIPPQPPSNWSSVTFSDDDDALFGDGPPATRLPVSEWFGISDINDSGSIAGYTFSGGYYTAGLWKGGVLLNLGLIPGYPFGSSYAFGVNIDHYVAGAQYSFYNYDEHRAPFLWHENIATGGDGKMIQLSVPFDSLQSEALAINKDGVAVGYSYSTSGILTGRLWQNGKNFSMTSRLNADAIAAGWTVQRLWDINDNGAIVASASRSGYNGLVLLVPDPAIQLITPSGDPVNAPVDTATDGQNEFTFDSSSPGILNLHLKAKVLAAGTASSLVSRTRFTVEPIGNIQPVWGTQNAGGVPTNNADFLEADVTYTGLPLSNSDFGRKTVTITVDGAIADQKVMEVFFPKERKESSWHR